MVSFPTRIWVSLQAGNTFRRLFGWSALWLTPWRKLQEKLQFESQNSNNLLRQRGETGWSFPTRKPGTSCLLPQVSGWSACHISSISLYSFFFTFCSLPNGVFLNANLIYSQYTSANIHL